MSRVYVLFFSSAVGFFLLGTLFSRAQHDVEEIEFYRYILALFFGIMFMYKGIQELKNLDK